MATIITGDLLKSDAQYIVHQCNCVTIKGANLSKSVFHKFPFANIYAPREKTGHKDTPGTIIIKGDGSKERFIINLLAQYYPGKSRYVNDTPQMRLSWFKKGLEEIEKIPNLREIAFPYNIGCGMAGGDWKVYKKAIDDFAKKLTKVKVFIIKLNEV